MKLLLITLLGVALSACAAPPIPEATPEAEQLKTVESSNDCQIIDVVIGRARLGQEIGRDTKLALIEAKNKAASLGADSIRILGSDDVSTGTAMGSRGGTVMVEALKCE